VQNLLLTELAAYVEVIYRTVLVNCELFLSILVHSCATNHVFIDTADVVRGAGSMKLSVVRLSVCPSVRCGWLATVDQAGKKYRLIAARSALSSKCEQCHVDRWRRS